MGYPVLCKAALRTCLHVLFATHLRLSWDFPDMHRQAYNFVIAADADAKYTPGHQ